jgi:Mg2+ and Co2+ transporter CorA
MEAKLTSTNWNDGLAFHPILLLTVRQIYDDSVWALRDLVRDAERQRTFGTSTSIVQPDFEHLHELARHAIHSNEVLDVALSTVKSLEDRCREFATRYCSPNLDSDYDTDIRDEFESIENDLRAIKRRSSTLHERLQNEIQLVRSILQLYRCFQDVSPNYPL